MSLHNDFKCLRNWMAGICFLWLCYATINDSFLRSENEKRKNEIGDLKRTIAKNNLDSLEEHLDLTEARFNKVFTDLNDLKTDLNTQFKNHTHNYKTGLPNEIYPEKLSD